MSMFGLRDWVALEKLLLYYGEYSDDCKLGNHYIT